MNKLISLFFISLFSLLVNTIYLQAQPSGLFSGYRLEEKNSQERKDSIKFNFNRENQPKEQSPSPTNEPTYKEEPLEQVPNNTEEQQQENSTSLNQNQPEIKSRKIFTSQPSSNKLINDFSYENKNSKKNSINSNDDVSELLDSGTPVDLEPSSSNFVNVPPRTSSPYRKQLTKIPQQTQMSSSKSYGSVDTMVYHSKLPPNYQSRTRNIQNQTRQLSNKKPIKYPNFLLFANDVICTTQAGITDGMIFYTPHGTYKLKGNLLISSNNTYLISGNRIWLDDMVYYFDDSGVYLNNKIYDFKNNVMYRDGVKYFIEGTVVVTEGLQGNHRCIVSELVE